MNFSLSVSNSRMPCSMIDNEESNQATFIRARSTRLFGLISFVRMSGEIDVGLCARESDSPPFNASRLMVLLLALKEPVLPKPGELLFLFHVPVCWKNLQVRANF